MGTTILAGALIDLDGTLLYVLLIFGLLFIGLYFVLFKPFLRLIDAREQAIDGARADAKRMQKEAREKSQKFEDELRKVRIEAGAERDRLRQEGQRLERQILDRVREETQEALASAEEQMQREATRVRSTLEQSVPAMGQSVASRLLGRELN